MEITIRNKKVEKIETCCTGMTEKVCQNTISFVIMKGKIKMLWPNSHYIGGVINDPISILPEMSAPVPMPGSTQAYPPPQPTTTSLITNCIIEYCPHCGKEIIITEIQ